MKLACVSTFLLAAICASASTVPRNNGGGGPTQCNTGTLQCCNTVQAASQLSGPLSILAGLLGVNLGNVAGLIGATCNPISVIGAGGNSCSAQPVCCTGNNFSGLLVLGCTPINVNV